MTTLTAKPRPPRAGETRARRSRSTRTTVVPKPLVALIALLGLALCAPSLAHAEFSRPFIGQITQAPTGPLGEEVPFTNLGGLAVDPLDDVYVGSHEGEAVDEFSSSSAFVEQIPGVPIGSLAFDDESGKLVGVGGEELVAVDNTSSATDGDVYFARPEDRAEGKSLVERKKSNGEPADFTCREPGWEEYIEGNKLTGKLGKPWEHGQITDIAVESGGGQYAGYIYVLIDEENEANVDRFTPAGCFVGAITGSALPEWTSEDNAFAGPSGVAVDPTTGDVLVEVINDVFASSWVIDEFSGSGEFLGRLTGSSKTDRFGRRGLYSGGITVSPEGELYVNVREVTEKEETEAVEHGEQPVGKYVVDEFGPGAFYPGAVTGGVTDVRSGAVTLNGVVSGVEDTATKEDVELSGCKFEYVSEAAFKLEGFAKAKLKECVPDLKGQRLKEEDYPVHAAIEGLQAGEVYRYRLVAETNPAERGIAKDGAAESFAAPAGRSWKARRSEMCRLRGRIFTRRSIRVGEDTTYQLRIPLRGRVRGGWGLLAGPDARRERSRARGGCRRGRCGREREGAGRRSVAGHVLSLSCGGVNAIGL